MKLKRDGVRCVKPVRWVKRVKRLELKEIGVVFGNLRVGLWDLQLRNVRSGIARDLTIFYDLARDLTSILPTSCFTCDSTQVEEASL